MMHPDTSTPPIIELKNIFKTYQLGQTTVSALTDISVIFNKGEFTAIIGPSGSGKSTLLNIIGCIDEPDSGTIHIEGTDTIHLDDKEKSLLRNHKIGFIFQSFNLIPVLSVYENVELPLTINQSILPAERKDRIRSALDDVGILNLANNRPDQLSGGQRQRVAIARALAGGPSLVLADEPTANLDSNNSHKIIDLMLELNLRHKVTFVFSTHDETLMARVSRRIQINDGVIRA